MNIDWIIRLRNNFKSPRKVNKEDVTKPEPFQVYYKALKRESR